MVHWQNHVSHRIDKLSLQPTETLEAQKLPWQPKKARISDEAVHAMSMAQLGDWITQQEKATEVVIPAELSLD